MDLCHLRIAVVICVKRVLTGISRNRSGLGFARRWLAKTQLNDALIEFYAGRARLRYFVPDDVSPLQDLTALPQPAFYRYPKFVGQPGIKMIAALDQAE